MPCNQIDAYSKILLQLFNIFQICECVLQLFDAEIASSGIKLTLQILGEQSHGDESHDNFIFQNA